MISWRWFPLVIASLVVSLPSLAASQSMTWQQWPAVGSATLTWGWWTIYDSELRSESGFYDARKPHALVITYQRDISRERLLKATDDQWKHLGFGKQTRDGWIERLSSAWPDVKEGEKLVFVRLEDRGVFYHKPLQGDFVPTVEVTDENLADAFLAIWLSPNTDYPSHRQKLIGG